MLSGGKLQKDQPIALEPPSDYILIPVSNPPHWQEHLYGDKCDTIAATGALLSPY